VEVKLIIYLIGGIIYFFYKVGKNIEKKNAKPAPPVVPNEPATQKTITPPDYSRDINRRKQQAELPGKPAEKPVTTAKPLPVEKKRPKEIFLHETKTASFGGGVADAPVYERTEDLKRIIPAEGGSSINYNEPVTGETEPVYELDARQAFIGSVIFERKY
jgi:hypothetical protein